MDSVNVGSFLRQNGHYASEMELLAIIRRMDTDGDAILVYSEWAEFIKPLSPARGGSPIRSSPPRASSANRTSYTSPLKASAAARSASVNRTASPVRASRSPVRTSPVRTPILRPHDEDELIHSLKELCNNE